MVELLRPFWEGAVCVFAVLGVVFVGLLVFGFAKAVGSSTTDERKGSGERAP